MKLVEIPEGWAVNFGLAHSVGDYERNILRDIKNI